MNPVKRFCQDRELKNRIALQRNRLYRIAYSWCHDQALSDDLVQDTITKALKKYTGLKKPDSLDCWLYGILANCWRDHFRKLKEFRNIDDCEFTLDETPETRYDRQSVSDTILAAVSDLSLNQRQVLSLVDLEGFSYSEVSDILDIPIGTVMSRLCRARKILAKTLLNLREQTHEDSMPFLRRVK